MLDEFRNNLKDFFKTLVLNRVQTRKKIEELRQGFNSHLVKSRNVLCTRLHASLQDCMQDYINTTCVQDYMQDYMQAEMCCVQVRLHAVCFGKILKLC